MVGAWGRKESWREAEGHEDWCVSTRLYGRTEGSREEGKLGSGEVALLGVRS